MYVGGPADGQPVLFIHGNCSSAAFWDPLWRRLPDSYFVVAPDLRGYGGTEAAPVDATRGLADFADDVAAVLDAVAPGVRPVVVGHSMGGGVALQFAIANPDRVPQPLQQLAHLLLRPRKRPAHQRVQEPGAAIMLALEPASLMAPIPERGETGEEDVQLDLRPALEDGSPGGECHLRQRP
mgnify:CR=1 FL=1